jgi:hypothetical protein
MSISKKERRQMRRLALRSIRDIITSYGIQFETIYYKKPFVGLTDLPSKKIMINLYHFGKADEFNPNDFRLMMSVAFHEMGHFLTAELGKFRVCVKAFTEYSLTDSEKIIYKRTALRAERYADKLGAQLLYSYFPDVPYEKTYINIEELDALKEQVHIMCEEICENPKK